MTTTYGLNREMYVYDLMRRRMMTEREKRAR